MKSDFFKIQKTNTPTLSNKKINTKKQSLELKDVIEAADDTINTQLRLLKKNSVITQEDVLAINKILQSKFKEAKRK